jgi:5'(3')-deoxyribonucleotidase
MKKTRYDLIPAYGLEEASKVLSSKLKKYARNEWKYGIKWTDVLSSLKRHLTAFEQGKDYTKENLLNIAEVAVNALILAEYYSTYPQGDDRIMSPVTRPIIGCDLDGVIFDFIPHFEKRFNIKLNPYWGGHYKLGDYLKELESEKEFWVTLPVLNRPSFQIDHYITARSVPKEWIEESIEANGLPCAPVHVVPWDANKVELLKNLKIDIFIDDKMQNYMEATDAGIFTYLMDAPHNRYYNVGHRRLFNLDKPLK